MTIPRRATVTSKTITRKPDAPFWIEIAQLGKINPFVLDLPGGSSHPRSQEVIHPLDDGYLENTTASDRGVIEGWLGSLETKTLTGILCIFDTLKHDMEIKILPGCTNDGLQLIQKFHGEIHDHYIPNTQVNP